KPELELRVEKRRDRSDVDAELRDDRALTIRELAVEDEHGSARRNDERRAGLDQRLCEPGRLIEGRELDEVDLRLGARRRRRRRRTVRIVDDVHRPGLSLACVAPSVVVEVVVVAHPTARRLATATTRFVLS